MKKITIAEKPMVRKDRSFLRQTKDEKEIRLKCLLMGSTIIIPARPHVFIDGIFYPINRCM